MGNVVWVACHARRPLQAARVAATTRAIERALPQLLGSRTPSSRSGRHVTLTAWADARVAPPTWHQVETAGRALGVNDGFPIGFDRVNLDGPNPLAIAAALRADFPAIDSFHPPYANITIDDDELSIGIDALGSAKVYRAESDGLTVWSNWASVASLFAYGSLQASQDGWASYLSHDRFLGDLTALERVHLEAPRTFVRAKDRPDGLQVIRTDHISPLFGSQWAVPDPPAAVNDALDRFYRSLSALGIDKVRIPLSGGRDSRVLAAVALRRDQVDEFHTSVPPELDREIAADLIARLDREIAWTHQDKSADVRRRDEAARTEGVTAKDIWERVVAYQGFADGDGDTTRRTPASVSEVPLDRISLWGVGGGFGRAFYYDEEATRTPELRTRKFWSSMRTGDPLVTEGARRQALPRRIDMLRAELSAHGVHDLKQLDYFEIFHRVRRTKNRVGTTSGIRPYLAPDYIRPSVTQTPAERVRTRYYEHVVRENYPRWVGVPFSHELKAARPEAASALSHAVAFWDSPYAQELGAELMELVRKQDLVDATEAQRYLTRPEQIDRWAVTSMRTFERLLNHFSYRAYVSRAGDAYRAAGGPRGGVQGADATAALVPPAARRAVSPVRLRLRRLRTRVVRAIGRDR